MRTSTTEIYPKSTHTSAVWLDRVLKKLLHFLTAVDWLLNHTNHLALLTTMIDTEPFTDLHFSDDVALLTEVLSVLFYARRYAVARPMLSGAKSDSVVRSQVRHGRPDQRFQSHGKGATQALRAGLWFIDKWACAM